MNRLDLDDARDRLLGRCLLRQAEAIPDRDFLIAGDERWSYGRVNELANAMARGFQELGVGRGDTVCLLMESSPAYVWTTLGLNKLGAIWVPTSPDYKGHWLRERLEDSRAQAAGGRRGAGPARRRVRRSAAVRARGGARERARRVAARALPRASLSRARARARQGARRPRALPGRHRRDSLDLGDHRPLEGRDAEPQRLDPRGGRRRRATRCCARAR